MKPDSDEILRLLAVLKLAYKTANLSYAAVAAAIGVSEPTVKRRMAGRGLSLQGLAELCRVADLRITDLAAMAGEKTQQERPRLSDVHIRRLVDDSALGLVCVLLWRGWSGERVARELSLDDAAFGLHLAELEGLGIIAVLPQNRIRFLRRMADDVNLNLAKLELLSRRVSELFGPAALRDPALAWRTGAVRLSPASFLKVEDRLNQFRDDIFAIGEQDLDLPPEQISWYAMFVGLRPVPVQAFMKQAGEALE